MDKTAMVMAMVMGMAGAAWGGVVQMLDGQSHQGQITLEEKNQLGVRTPDGRLTRVDLDQVMSAQFQVLATTNASPWRWVGRDLGAVRAPGSVRFAEDTATVRGSGVEMEGAKEGGYFVYQMLEGDGQIVARVTAVQKSDRRAIAGLMIRVNAEVGVPYAMVMTYAEGGTRFQHRMRLGAATPRVSGPQLNAPCWLKLVRQGNRITGYASENGEDWQQVGAETVTLPERAMVGLVVCARSEANIGAATFEGVAVTAGGARGASSGAGAFRGVVLRQGSRVGGQIRAMSDSAVRVWRDREVSIPATDVSYIQWTPMRGDVAAKLQVGRKGVLLSNGDFVEGDVLGLENGRLKVSSVLFGLQRVEMERAIAVVVGESARVPTRYAVRLSDGSILLSDRVSLEGNKVGIEVPFFGVLQFPVEQIVEIRAGESKVRWLAEMKPTKVATDDPDAAAKGYMAYGSQSGVAMLLGGQACAQGIDVRAGTSVSYALDGSYNALTFRAGAPDPVRSTAAVRFVVLGDGREIYRSPDRRSGDEPVMARLKVEGVKELVLRVESSEAAARGASGLFGEPALLK